jgi:hypothetical protein
MNIFAAQQLRCGHREKLICVIQYLGWFNWLGPARPDDAPWLAADEGLNPQQCRSSYSQPIATEHAVNFNVINDVEVV